MQDAIDARDIIVAKAPQDIGEHEGAEVADMAVVIDREAAVVHGDDRRLDRLEHFHPVRQRVVEADLHEDMILATGGGFAMDGGPSGPRVAQPQRGKAATEVNSDQ